MANKLPTLRSLGNRVLRRKGKPYKTKDYKENRDKFLVSNPIETRPIETNNRMRLGDWEIDTVVGWASLPTNRLIEQNKYY